MSLLKSLGNAAAAGFGSAMAKWNTQKSPTEVVEVNAKQVSSFTVLSSSPSSFFSLLRESGRDGQLHVVYDRRLSVFRADSEQKARERLQHLDRLQVLFSFVASDRGQFDALIGSVHLHPFWEGIHHSSACGITAFIANLAQDAALFATLLNSPCHPEGSYPLHIAASSANLPVVRQLILLGADLSKLDLERQNVVHHAAGNSLAVLQELAKSRSFFEAVDAKSGFGYTPLFCAIRARQADCVAALLHYGANTDVLCLNRSPLQEAITLGVDPPALQTICALIKAKPSLILQHSGPDNDTVLHSTTDKIIMGILLKSCPMNGINVLNGKGQSPLHCAAVRNNARCAVTLLAYGADVQAANSNGDTPLHLATQHGALLVVKALLCFGANINVPNKEGRTAVQLDASIKDKTMREAVQACLVLFSSYSAPSPRADASAVLEEFMQTMALSEKSRHRLDARNVSASGGQPKFVNLLSLDGGGIRGLVLIQTLLHIEQILQESVWTKFGWVAGTSTGAILTVALAQGRSLRECQRLYFRFKDEVFLGKRPYSTNVLESFLKTELGEKNTMAHITTPRIMLTTAVADKNPPKLLLHRNYRLPLGGAENDALGFDDPGRTMLWKAVRCSSAAPTYFATVDGKYVDGGLIANNPTLDLLSDVQLHNGAAKYSDKKQELMEIGCVLSLGTGQVPPQAMDSLDIAPPAMPTTVLGVASVMSSSVASMMSLNNLKNILVEQVTAAEGRPVDRSRSWCHSSGIPFFRFSTPLKVDIGLDVVEDEVLIGMLWDTEVYLRTYRQHDVRALVDFLRIV